MIFIHKFNKNYYRWLFSRDRIRFQNWILRILRKCLNFSLLSAKHRLFICIFGSLFLPNIFDKIDKSVFVEWIDFYWWMIFSPFVFPIYNRILLNLLIKSIIFTNQFSFLFWNHHHHDYNWLILVGKNESFSFFLFGFQNVFFFISAKWPKHKFFSDELIFFLLRRKKNEQRFHCKRSFVFSLVHFGHQKTIIFFSLQKSGEKFPILRFEYFSILNFPNDGHFIHFIRMSKFQMIDIKRMT